MQDLLGKTILGYQLVENLGSGAYGTVYKAVKENPTGRYTRALKYITLPSEKQYADVLNAMGGDLEKTNAYFDQLFNEIFSEVKILNEFTEMDVPNVVRYFEHDLDVTDNPKTYNLYILMEYLTPFQDYLSDEEVTVGDSVKMTLDILKGLSASHTNGVIHRDVKLDNIFVTNNGNYKIGDFGVSKILDNETRAQSLKGTPDFIAPEVYLGKEGYDNSVDLYSLGIVLYRLLNYNRNPFLPKFPETYNPADEDDAFNKRMAEQIPELPMLGGEEVGNVILKAIAPREERFKTADEFYSALITAVNNTPAEEMEVVINGEGTPFFNSFSSLRSGNSMPREELNETVIVERTPTNDNAQTVSQGNRQVNQTPPPPPPPQNNYPNQGNNYPNQGNRNPNQEPYVTREDPNRRMLYWIAAIIGILALFAIAYFMFGRSNNNNSATPPPAATTSVAAPTYSVQGGQYEVPQYVKINDSDPNAKIYYTLDGTEPTEGSMLYTNGNEIKVAQNTTLRSIAVDSNGNKSPVSSADYVISEPQTAVADTTPAPAPTQTAPADSYPSSATDNSYILPSSNSRVISESELYNLSEDEVALARNEIFARKGRRFDTDWIRDYFYNQEWYSPKYSPEEFDANSNSILSDVEKKNVQIIQAYEQRMGYD